MANTFSMEDLPVLRTPRLLLRPYRSDDVDDVLAYATDPEWGRYLPLPDPYIRRSAEEFVARCILVDGETRFEWAIVHEGRVSGGISLRVYGSGSAEMGYSIARPLWGRGLTTEAATAVIAHGFEELGLARIQAAADIRNDGSWRVMEKVGMQRTGVAHSDRLVRGERVDSVFYEVLAEGWSPPATATLATEGPPDLRTERLVLRPFNMGDVEDVLAYASDPEWNRYLGLPEPYTHRSAEEFVSSMVLADWETNPMWAIVHEGRVCGGINLTTRGRDQTELGYSITRPLWGQGFMTEAARAVIDYGFQSMGLARIYSFADIRNKCSWRVMEKLGMEREGVMRSNRQARGEYVDDVLYAILRDEWSAPA